jgi:chromate transport protein ChrA
MVTSKKILSFGLKTLLKLENNTHKMQQYYSFAILLNLIIFITKTKIFSIILLIFCKFTLWQNKLLKQQSPWLRQVPGAIQALHHQ